MIETVALRIIYIIFGQYLSAIKGLNVSRYLYMFFQQIFEFVLFILSNQFLDFVLPEHKFVSSLIRQYLI